MIFIERFRTSEKYAREIANNNFYCIWSYSKRFKSIGQVQLPEELGWLGVRLKIKEQRLNFISRLSFEGNL